MADTIAGIFLIVALVYLMYKCGIVIIEVRKDG
jgi:hypothetical protein